MPLHWLRFGGRMQIYVRVLYQDLTFPIDVEATDTIDYIRILAPCRYQRVLEWAWITPRYVVLSIGEPFHEVEGCGISLDDGRALASYNIQHLEDIRMLISF